jgi:hypothetical protein
VGEDDFTTAITSGVRSRTLTQAPLGALVSSEYQMIPSTIPVRNVHALALVLLGTVIKHTLLSNVQTLTGQSVHKLLSLGSLTFAYTRYSPQSGVCLRAVPSAECKKLPSAEYVCPTLFPHRRPTARWHAIPFLCPFTLKKQATLTSWWVYDFNEVRKGKCAKRHVTNNALRNENSWGNRGRNARIRDVA